MATNKRTSEACSRFITTSISMLIRPSNLNYDSNRSLPLRKMDRTHTHTLSNHHRVLSLTVAVEITRLEASI